MSLCITYTSTSSISSDVFHVRPPFLSQDAKLGASVNNLNNARHSSRPSITRITASPFATAPPEILTMIFLHCNDTSTVSLPPRPGSYPWFLSHVCSHWSKVVWSSPEVWCNIGIQGSREYYKSTPHLRDALHGILTRTEGLIHLSVVGYAMHDISDLILAYSRRFRGLELQNVPSHTLFALLELPRGSLAHLETLHAVPERQRFGASHITSRFETLRHDLPSLRRLHILSDSGPRYFSYLPLSQLTDLAITTSRTTAFDVHTVVRLCSSLIRLEFKILFATPTTQYDPPARIILPALESLFATAYTADLVLLLDTLVLPSLSSFTATNEPDPELNGALISLLSRSGCTLRHLSIHTSPQCGPDPYLSQLLEYTPRLVSFASTSIATSTSIRLIHGGQFPLLAGATWVVDTDALQGLLDLLDERIARSPAPADPTCRIDVTCFNVWDPMLAVWERVANDHAAYRAAGFDLDVHDIGGTDVRAFVNDSPH